MTKKRMMRKLSGRGDETVAEWDETATPERLAEVEAEFNDLMRKGFFAADLRDDTIIHKFDPAADILIIPRLTGG